MHGLKGFTLMELLIVVSLIMILSVVGMGSFTLATIKSKDTQRKNNLNQIVKAIESFYTDVGRYPLSADGDDFLRCYIKDGTSVTNSICEDNKLYAVIDQAMTTYIVIPEDPDPSQKYVYISADGFSYEIYAALENMGDKDLLRDEAGHVITDPWGVECGTGVSCNYKVTETGLVKSL
ncbi:MAG: Type II secretion system protein G [Candidatus Collierbacteria bacterium GW2011_GWB1_44_6]|uniref:Type II secretion system protein G n=2 Tax=Candidatus Collieribacteriota TaxID=1752725 RepID=A0A0G1JP65_9BACT|nr:MAG: Type II secretion system protein G [Candidatus Collierbacteria bacterium GW2011_GWC2_43_12]KKT73351.1 MAG: Type II secretion system protein G [Candidatus Collierbacteria bacterium GW2011_GWB1_44_6]